MNHNGLSKAEQTSSQLHDIGEKFLELISEGHVAYKILGRDTDTLFFRNKELGNVFAATRTPSVCEAPLTSFIFWQSLMNEDSSESGHDYYVFSFARSGHVLKGIMCITDEVNTAKRQNDLPDVGYGTEDIDMSSIARSAEAKIASDGYQQEGLEGALEIREIREILENAEPELALLTEEC